MGLRVLPPRVVAVVGGEQGQVEIASDAQQRRVDAGLVGEPVVLELHVEAVRAEHVSEAGGQLPRAGLVVGEEPLAHRAAEAAARRDDPVAVRLEHVEVDTRLVEEPVEVRERRQLHQVVVAGVRHREEREVEDVVLVATGPVEAARRDEVRLHADDRLHAVLAGDTVEVQDAVHVPVVGDPDRGLSVRDHGRDHVRHPGRAVEHRVLGVQVQVHERRRHGLSDTPTSTLHRRRATLWRTTNV